MAINADTKKDNSAIGQDGSLDYFCDITLINTVCRVCLEKKQNKEMLNIFDMKKYHMPKMMMACADIQVAVGDGLPNQICNKCFTKLNIAWQFKLQCENADAKLRHWYLNNQIQHISVDFEDSLDSLLKRHEGILPTQEFKPVATTAVETVKLVEEPNNVVNKRGTKKLIKKDPKIHQCGTCAKTFNRREYLTQHIRIHTGEKPFHCLLCEKRFVNSGHLTIHMRTHTGEKPHSCTLCPKAFSTRQEVRKHLMVHSGDRPFSCKICKRTFSSSSNLYSHLKHHTGEKNFTCEVCGKAFYTKQELRQHLVVHTGEKPYLCEHCDKRFSQIGHLKRHYKLHK